MPSPFLGPNILGSLIVVIAGALGRPAWAACADVACGRVDYVEVTDTRTGAPIAAKLHGAFAWEASPDACASHPVGGSLKGFVWLSCIPASGPVDATCTQALTTELAKTGTSKPLTFTGAFYDTVAKGPQRPPGLYAEGEAGSRTRLADLQLGGSPSNPAICTKAFSLPGLGGDAAAPAGFDAGDDAGVAGKPKSDNSGCLCSLHRTRSTPLSLPAALVGLALARRLRRRRVG
jgi:hypothetical protein